MTYQAIVGAIQTAPHPNADRLQIGYIYGARTIIDLEAKDGDIYVYFPPDGQLSLEYCKEHDLVGYKDEHGEKKGGYFSENRRVRSQNFRGVKSEGFAMPLQSLQFTGYDLTKLKAGDQFDELNKVPLCNKFYTEATIRAMKNKGRTSAKWLVDMPEHYDTTQFRFVTIPEGAVVHISEKEHGTSFRYGHVRTKTERPFWSRFWSAFFWRGDKKYTEQYEYVLGTRRAILPRKNDMEFGGGFYGNGDPYTLAPKHLHNKLKENEIVYGEIVGYLQTGAALFHQDTDKLPEIKKQYGKRMVFSYGCIEGNSRLAVYRITQDGRDLSWFELQHRCSELGVETVKNLETIVFDGNRDALNAKIETMIEGPSTIDPRHIREGVCLRVEHSTGNRICKAKSWTFGVLEGFIKDDSSYVDAEEIA